MAKSNVERYRELREMNREDFITAANAAGVEINENTPDLQYTYAMRIAVQESRNRKSPEQLAQERYTLGIY